MMDSDGNGILRKLVSNWDHLKLQFQRLHSTAEARPADGWELFQQVPAVSPTLASFKLSPVVFNLPERANHVSTDLFVVVEGILSFERSEFIERNVLVTHDFGTKVAYFRRSSNSLDHVFGAHYDFSLGEIGHPAFHGQLRSYLELSEKVKSCYHIDEAVVDCVRGLLKTVRVPTAQMDVFSLFVQLGADHLLYNKSGPEEKAAFNSLLQRSFCQGAAFRVPGLETEEARTCYRARHWYPAIP
jgi:hypothetical protein